MILIADDQAVNQMALSIILDKLNYPSILAEDGEDALEKAILHDVDMIFMDIQMPRMTGYEAAENLRKRGFKKPIIAVTASELSEERENCLKAGINDIIIKPFKRNDIEGMLKKWLPAWHPPEQVENITQSTAESQSDTAIVFDAAGMLENFLNEVGVVLPLISRFIERTHTQIEDMPNLENAENWEEARRLAHMIKGAALTMGGAELGKTAARLELAYKNVDKDEINAAFPPFKEAFDRYKKEAESFIQSRS
ncbi:MAG: response regulator [Treponema sp.]|nr:response regulator [Treponema sp.]